MKKLKQLFLYMMLCTVSFSSFAIWDGNYFFNPYVGVEGAWRHMPWESNFGEGHFRDNYMNANAILGVQIHKYLAIEGGYQSTNRADQQRFYFGDNNAIVDSVLGYLDAVSFDPSIHMSQAQIRGGHINLVGLLPVLPKTTLYASVGAAWMRFYVNTARIQTTEALLAVHHWHSDNKALLRLNVGVKQMITGHFGARVFASWENTSKLQGTIAAINPAVNPTDFYTAKAKNSFLFGVGFFYQLCNHKKLV